MKPITAALAIVAIVALLWIASEQHYQGCVSAAEATTPPPQAEASGPGQYGGVFSGEDGAERTAAVAKCSRLP